MCVENDTGASGLHVRPLSKGHGDPWPGRGGRQQPGDGDECVAFRSKL